jgi:hypothetical protein
VRQRDLLKHMHKLGLGLDEIAAELSRRYDMHPRRAYRLARGLTPKQASDIFNSLARIGTGPSSKAELTVYELLRYERVTGDRQPVSVNILNLLAAVYWTNAPHLMDLTDWELLNPSDRLLIDRATSNERQREQSITALIIGQAAVLLTAIIAIIYAAGAFYLGLKLWLIGDPWTAVLGQLPRDILLVNAIARVIPLAAIMGTSVYLAYRKFSYKDREISKLRRVGVTLLTVSFASAAAAVSPYLLLTFLKNHFHYHYEVLRPGPFIILCWVLSFITFALALGALRAMSKVTIRSGKSRLMWTILGTGILTAALIPWSASIASVFPLPTVALCGPAFSQSDARGHDYMSGNLIGSSGQWAYVAQVLIANNNIIPRGQFVAVVPLSSVKVESIGHVNCDDLSAASEILESGYYVNGLPGTRRWFIRLKNGLDGDISGTIAMQARDGQTGMAQTFTGHVLPGLATLTFSRVGIQTATFGTEGIQVAFNLGMCRTYLRAVSSNAGCKFAHVTSIDGIR